MVVWGRQESWGSADLLTDSHQYQGSWCSHKAVNKVSQRALSDKARTISIWVNSHPSDQAGLIHTGPWEQPLGEHTLAEVDTELGSTLPVQQ